MFVAQQYFLYFSIRHPDEITQLQFENITFSLICEIIWFVIWVEKGHS